MATGAVASVPLVLAACGGDDKRSATNAEEKPKKGGRLRVGSVGVGKAESCDPAIGYNTIDIARFRQLYSYLVKQNADGSGAELSLAESIEPNSDGSVWNVKIKEGVEFHNGKTFTAADAIYSMTRPFDTEAGLSGSALSAFMDTSGFKKISDTEFEMRLKTPVGDLPIKMVGRDCLMYPEGTSTEDFKKRPIGTGPFKYESFKAGERSLFSRNDNYWEQGGGPYVDEVEIIAINDSGARANALLAGEIDCAEAFDYDQARAYKDNDQLQLLDAVTTGTYPYVFRTDTDPFKDADVRLAMKLAMDRPKMVDIAFAGFGTVANDMFGKGLFGYPDDLPQREYDPEQARALLKKAGHDSLDVTLYWPVENAGQKAAPVYAEQAKAAGINLKVEKFPAGTDMNVAPTFPAFITNWGNTILDVGIWMLTTSTYNEGWFNKGWDRMFQEASATTDSARRDEIMKELNKIWYEESGHMIWGYYNNVDGLAANVRGAYPSKVEFGLSNYDYKAYWLA
jgi:peptide/nickel transport system substrate-binding protein